QTQVTKATVDGEDEMNAEKDRSIKNDEKNERTESPFAPRNQRKYQFTMLTPERIAFHPKGDPDPGVHIGEALIDPATGELINLWLNPSKNQMFCDRLNMQLEYDAHTDAGRALSKFSLQGAGSFLFIKRSGDLTITFHFDEEKAAGR